MIKGAAESALGREKILKDRRHKHTQIIEITSQRERVTGDGGRAVEKKYRNMWLHVQLSKTAGQPQVSWVFLQGGRCPELDQFARFTLWLEAGLGRKNARISAVNNSGLSTTRPRSVGWKISSEAGSRIGGIKAWAKDGLNYARNAVFITPNAEASWDESELFRGVGLNQRKFSSKKKKREDVDLHGRVEGSARRREEKGQVYSVFRAKNGIRKAEIQSVAQLRGFLGVEVDSSRRETQRVVKFTKKVFGRTGHR
ncbi:hypothetical protein B0H19DRAFT_1067400 [Mycena capillaripes]|nr:hypothetical protein B0H19DRAFT_1067400 [Mycena capillaripes]